MQTHFGYRKTGTQGVEYCIGKIDPKKNETDYVCTDDKLYDSGDMIYRIEGEMENGNTVSVTLEPIKVDARPLADLQYTSEQVVGVEYSYDATGSINAADITKVAMDFGDGGHAEKSSVESAVFTHTFEKTGTFTVSLTVTNKSGGFDTKTVTVTVSEPSVSGNVLVKVSRMDGSAASNVTVYADLGTDQQTRYKTDAGGTVLIPCAAGTHEFGVFDTGYLPVRKYCAVVPDTTSELQFTVQQEQLVKADFSINRMSLSEIQAAGIDVEDPQNCNLVKINVSLTYHITTTVTDLLMCCVSRWAEYPTGHRD